MTTRLVMSFSWMVALMVLAALSFSSASSLPNETRIEAFDIDQIINEIRGIQDANQIQSRAFDIKKYRGKKDSPIQCPAELRIAAFNIQALATPKFNDDKVMKIISKIISQYHVILIQEVRIDETELVDKINKLRSPSPYTYKAWASKPLGSTKYYTERYVFLIRDGTGISLRENYDTYQFEQEKELFERAPFSIRIRCSDIEFVLTAIHAKPDAKKAEDEIKHLLDDVYKAITNKWENTNNILIMGDLNTGYLDDSVLKTLKKVKDQKNQTFYWPFHENIYRGNIARIATTVCSYEYHDGFIMTQDLKTMVAARSAKVFEFDKEYDQAFKTIAACCVSDHYPIELTLTLRLEGRNKRPPPIHKAIKKGKPKNKHSVG